MGWRGLFKHAREPLTVNDDRHGSLALSILAQELSVRGKARILDLGAASSALLPFYSKYSSKLHFEDLSSQIRDSGSTFTINPEDSISALQSGQRFDAIVAWDILNYLSLADIQILGSLLERCSADGATLYALGYLEDRKPASPQMVASIEQHGFSLKRLCGRSLAHTPITFAQLRKAFPAFRLYRSCILKSGLEEYLLRYQPQLAQEVSVQEPASTQTVKQPTLESLLESPQAEIASTMVAEAGEIALPEQLVCQVSSETAAGCEIAP